MGGGPFRRLPAPLGGHLRLARGGHAQGRRRLRLDRPHAGRRDRLRPRRVRMVVHPLALGPHLREHPQRRGDRPAGGDRRMGRRRDVLLRGQGAVLGIDPHRSAGLGVHRARNQDLRPDPEDLLLRRTGARLLVRPPARQLEDGLHLGAQHAVPQEVLGRVGTPTRGRSTPAQLVRTERGAFGPLSGVFLLIPFIVFFNLWSNWGATLYGEVRGALGLPQEHRRDAARWSRPRSWPRSRFSCS